MKFSWQKNNPIICSAPMHGITNSAQRQIFKLFGADLVFSEMVSSMGLEYNNPRTFSKARFQKEEKPIIIQVFGHSTKETVNAAISAQEMGADGIDFNCGCPARNMLASGNGGKLLLTPDKLIDILKNIKKSISIPLSLKTRIGYDSILNTEYYQNIAQKTDIDCLILHGRTVKQRYTGQADWEQIKKIATSLNIPVIGSGDIIDAFTAQKRIQNYTPSGIMIGRGALGNPWIFEQIKKLLQGKKIRPVFNIKKNIKVMTKHSKLLITELGDEKKAITQMRKHYGWYIKNFPDAKKYRKLLFEIKTLKELKNITSRIK